MKRGIALLALTGILVLSSCVKKESAEAPGAATEPATSAEQSAAPAQTVEGPHAFVRLKNGTSIPGVIVASSRSDMVVAGDDGIEHKIPLTQVQAVEYAEAGSAAAAARRQPARETAAAKKAVREEPARPAQNEAPPQTAQRAEEPLTPAPPPAVPKVTTRTYELPAGSELSVRTDEPIDSSTAQEGQTFDAQVTRNATDANGDVVIPRGADAKIVILSASKGGRFRGQSDLVLDLQSVTINGKQYRLDTADVTREGKSGVGANRRTATHVGGGAALGAIIGAIAGGGKGAAIGAGAGAGAGALAQVLTKGKSIKVPVESVLTFRLDEALKVTAAQ